MQIDARGQRSRAGGPAGGRAGSGPVGVGLKGGRLCKNVFVVARNRDDSVRAGVWEREESGCAILLGAASQMVIVGVSVSRPACG